MDYTKLKQSSICPNYIPVTPSHFYIQLSILIGSRDIGKGRDSMLNLWMKDKKTQSYQRNGIWYSIYLFNTSTAKTINTLQYKPTNP